MRPFILFNKYLYKKMIVFKNLNLVYIKDINYIYIYIYIKFHYILKRDYDKIIKSLV